MKGFTLIELIVVIAILFSVALVGTNTIIEFQRNAILTAAVQELASTLRTAQTNSIAGQLEPGETAGTFSSTGLPYFGVTFSDNAYRSYRLVRVFTLASPTPTPTPNLLQTVDSSITVTTLPPNITTVMFSRVTGLPDAAVTFTLTRTNTTTSRTITVNGNGLISL